MSLSLQNDYSPHPSTRQRLAEIDGLKATAILAVVLIHAISTSFAQQDPVAVFLGNMTRFAVPGLLFAAGFLFDKSNRPARMVCTKVCIRIMPPYLFCSLAVQAAKAAFPEVFGSPPPTWRTLFSDLFWANSLGIYYYVFVIVYLYAFSLILRRLSTRVTGLLWGMTLAITILFYARPADFVPVGPDRFFLVLLRHPCVHLLPYLSGWMLDLLYPALQERLKRRRKWILISALLCDAVLMTVAMHTKSFFSTEIVIQFHVYTLIAALLAAGIGHFQRSPVIDFFSRSSYGIFLLHLPLVRLVQRGLAPSGFSIPVAAAAWAGGVSGSVLIILLARRLSKKYAFYVVGA